MARHNEEIVINDVKDLMGKLLYIVPRYRVTAVSRDGDNVKIYVEIEEHIVLEKKIGESIQVIKEGL